MHRQIIKIRIPQTNKKQIMVVSKYAPETNLINYKTISPQELTKQIKDLRYSIQTLNMNLNKMLNKYQIMKVPQFISSTTIHNQPEKEAEILTKQIANNNKVLEYQKKQLLKIQQIWKDYQERDHLIELQQFIRIHQQSIHDKKKLNIIEKVKIDKKDNTLIEMKEQKTFDEANLIKAIKQQVIYQFKRFHQNKAKIAELDKNIEDICKRDDQNIIKLNNYKTIVEENSLQVKINKPFIQLKKQYNSLVSIVEEKKRKNQVIVKSHSIFTSKIEKQIQQYEKQSVIIDQKISSLEQVNQQKSNKIQEIFKNYHIDNKSLQSIAYKFAQNKNNNQIDRFKPNLKIKRIKKQLTNPQLFLNNSKDLHIFEQKNVQNKLFKINHQRKSSDNQINSLMINDKNTLYMENNKSNNKPQWNIKKQPSIDISKEIGEQIKNEKQDQSPLFKPQRINRLAKLRQEKAIQNSIID